MIIVVRFRRILKAIEHPKVGGAKRSWCKKSVHPYGFYWKEIKAHASVDVSD
jgi:hypothetical protein